MTASIPTGAVALVNLPLSADGHWKEKTTVRQLLRLVEPLQPDVSCQCVLDRFLVEGSVYALPLVDEAQRPVALIDRTAFIEFFSHRFSRDIFGRRRISDLLLCDQYDQAEPLVVEEGCAVEDAAQMIISAGMQHMVSGFIISSQGRYLGVANGRDLLNIITQRKQAELHYLAHYDALTGIPNRAYLADRLDRACREADRRGHLVALLFIDVDRFKQINDSLGHSAGDEVLRRVVGRLRSCVREVDTVARLAGDEFVILMEGVSDPAQTGVLAERIVASMREPIDIPGHALVVTVSIGSALYPSDSTVASSLLSKADVAMYEAKIAGRNGFCSYQEGMASHGSASVSLENDLRRAIERNEFELHFQPQLSMDGRQLLGVEALVRWRHPGRGLVPPMQFIPLAEESGLIVGVGEWVVQHALAQARAWLDRGFPALPVSVNISALQFRQPAFPAFLADQLARYDIPAGLLELELTESVLMKDQDAVLNTLNRVKALGVRLAIDDFGTGFSSLSYLRRFPIDRLKIDQSFVRGIESTPVNESIATAIVALARSLMLEVVAEGIESKEEAVVLERIQCQVGQGYLYARPLEAGAFEAWLQARSAGSAP